MVLINVEIKALSKQNDHIREILKKQNADFKGMDHQIDTYFRSSSGRLKLREGNIENHLIYYEREDVDTPKQSRVILYKTYSGASIKEILEKAMGVLVVVDKKREIYFIDNVKFHLDDVRDLGSFIEIEAIDNDGSIGSEALHEQCEQYMCLFGIKKDELIAGSYSDMLLNI